ncbi:MAG: TonB family protein [Pseudobdellovibrionaceae bacterium]|nr:TonB family protein [Bdellovibrionales bacterium]USN46987.1 MAG: TonB family protein [Pseudobdellovibrionaceae bacterium]
MSAVSQHSPFDDRFQQFIVLSVGFHLALFVVFTVKTLWFPSKDLIIQNAIRVDMVALPEKMAPDVKPEVNAKPQPKPLAKPVAKDTPKPKKKIDNKKSKQSTLEEAIKKLKTESAIDDIAKSLESKPKNSPPPPTYAGNIISSGDSFTGLTRIQFDDYYSQIKVRIRENWDLPQWLADADLKAQATVSLDERGYVTGKQILISSGNSVFDEIVLSTIEASSPFPAPPDRLRGALQQGALVLNFPE